MRARSLHISTFSIRKPSQRIKFASGDRYAFKTTSYLLPVGIFEIVITHVKAIVSHPLRYYLTISKSLQHRAPGIRSFIWSIFYFAEAILLAAKLKEAEINHVHNHFANASAIVGLLASRYLDLTWSLTLHGTVDWEYPSGYLLPGKIEAASFVACVSHYGRAQACLATTPANWDKLFVSRCGVDFLKFPTRLPETQDDRLQILNVGRLSPEKAQLGLLKAFANVLASGIDAELRIIGDGPLYNQLLDEISELNLGDRCFLMGQKTEEEVFEQLLVTDLFVLSSFIEGLPVVLIEALGMKVPVVAPYISGVPELVQHQESGLLFPAGDWNALTAQMSMALHNPDLRKSLAENGFKRVCDEFEISRAVTPLLEKFTSMSLNKKPQLLASNKKPRQ